MRRAACLFIQAALYISTYTRRVKVNPNAIVFICLSKSDCVISCIDLKPQTMFLAGFAQGMVSSLKSNARDKRDRFQSMKDGKEKSGRYRRIKRKQPPKAQVERAKQAIIEAAKQDQRRITYRTIAIVISILLVPTLLYIFVLKEHMPSYTMPSVQRVAVPNYKKPRPDREQIYLQYIHQGKALLLQESYTEAKRVLMKANAMNPEKFEGIYQYTKACILDCKTNGIDCDATEARLQYIQTHFKHEPRVKDLETMWKAE